MNETNNLLELPEGWALATISDLIDEEGVFIDGDWVESKDQDPNGDVRLIQLADVGDGVYRNKSSRYLTLQKSVDLGCTYLIAGDVLIARMPDPLGRACIFPGDTKTSVTVVDVCIVRTGAHGVNNKWLMYAINSHKFRVEVAALQSGSTRKRISRGNLATLKLPIPPLLEQQRIVNKVEELFTKLDAGINALKKARAQLGRYRQAVLKAAVTGELTREWREAHRGELEPAADLLARILTERRAKWEVDQLAKMLAAGKPPKNDDWKQKYQEPIVPNTSELPGLPGSWMWTRAEQLCDFITKGTTPAANKLFSESGEIPFIKVYNLTHIGRLDFTVKPTFVSYVTHNGELARSKVISGDVLMNIVGPPLGKVSIVPNTYEEWNINQAVAVFRPMPSFDRKYLSICLLTTEIQSWAEQRAKATAGQFNLTLEICRDLPLPLPSLLEQQQIVSEVEHLLSIADAMEQTIKQSLKQSERLRQSILQQAFAGQLVPQDPNDEPASRLLERIREERAHESEAAPKQKRKSSKHKQAAQTSFFS